MKSLHGLRCFLNETVTRTEHVVKNKTLTTYNRDAHAGNIQDRESEHCSVVSRYRQKSHLSLEGPDESRYMVMNTANSNQDNERRVSRSFFYVHDKKISLISRRQLVLVDSLIFDFEIGNILTEKEIDQNYRTSQT